jgi:hypothetical protein
MPADDRVLDLPRGASASEPAGDGCGAQTHGKQEVKRHAR